MTTVVSSVASIDSSGDQMKEAPARSFAASMLASTASASTGSPSWKVAPSRIVNVQVRPSSLVSQDSAMPGVNSSSAPSAFFQRSGS